MRVIVGVGLCCLMLLSTPVLAQSAGTPDPDVRVIFDVSGSMKDNDPERLSANALELLVALLPSGVHGGVWTFGETVDNALPVASVDPQWRERALALTPALAEYQQFTDIEAAIREAANSPENGQRHLILLTDGMIDLPARGGDKAARDAESRRRLLDELAPELAKGDVVIHAIAFSPQADLDLVERLAQETGGLATLVETPETLLRAFLGITERIFPVDQLPFEEGRFTIDPGIDSFSALLFHDPDTPPLTLIDPEGRRYRADEYPEGARWQSESRFDLITIPSPQEGEWRVEGEFTDDSRVSVDSPLVLRTSELPTTLYMGFGLALSAWLERNDIVLDTDALPSGLQMRAELQDPQGDVRSAVALEESEGRFEGMLPAPRLIGNARLVIAAISDAFNRQRVQAVNVLPAISAQLDGARHRVILNAEHPRLDADNTVLHAELQGESLEVNVADARRWRVDLPSLEPDISVPLLLSATITLDGQIREIRLPRLMLNPGGEITLGEARIDGANVQTQQFPSEAEPEATKEELADRLVSAINALPRQAQSLWREARPGVERLAREHGDDPRLWIFAGMALLVLVVIGLWHRMAVRRRRRLRRVEEPHV
ncbi:hypothetical protein GCM10007160_07800 [Litchfieldella qijiaojingensis]|uniref:VWFA domain-containing protein n=1 Tax=Litchfieldella qijiaojingensis TaxID=980347 RepID=A0ABQ2YFQ5_9GAMM|nr:vWA domain-containing protein [Halomonas qijiaojingensis]GGX82777.1 hypothetical protein GCM10007160_07800 [Halomonas qijiaojingensis]